MNSSPVAVTQTSDIAPVLSKESLDIQATTECGFTLKHVRDVVRTYSQMHRTDKYSQYNQITEVVVGSSPVAVTIWLP